MSNTYSQLYVHSVFAVKQRIAMIPKEHKDEIARYSAGLLRNKGNIQITANYMPDHVHILFIHNPNESISSIMRDLKSNLTLYINKTGKTASKFEWQSGYGAFSCGRQDLSTVAGYINNQEEHHKKFNFKEEYLKILREKEIEFEDKYLFDWLNESNVSTDK